jgi:hypothetical protein
VLELLTADLARRNPQAYAAHFQRLAAKAQRGYLAGLAEADLSDHARALGLGATLGFTLRLGTEVELEASVAGKPLAPTSGWAHLELGEARGRALASTLGAPVVTGLLHADLAALERHGGRLLAAGWEVRTVTLTEDLAPDDSAEWALAGALTRGGCFWSTRQLLPPTELAEVSARLEAVAVTCAARFRRERR